MSILMDWKNEGEKYVCLCIQKSFCKVYEGGGIVFEGSHKQICIVSHFLNLAQKTKLFYHCSTSPDSLTFHEMETLPWR
jgi:hypothetical protein